MNSDPENLSSTPKKENSSASEAESIDDLINFLLEPETSAKESTSKVQNTIDYADYAKLSSEEIELLKENFDLEQTIDDENSTTGSNCEAEDLAGTAIEVEIKSVAEPTLVEAVEYQAFLQQTVEPKTTEAEIEQVSSLEEVAAIDTGKASPEDLADAVNSLIPLIVELLQFKLNNSKEGVIQTVRPILDQLIEQRTLEDSQKMADAIAKILPDAITAEINFAPEAIARAIAPEIASSIREQILLNEQAIPQVLGPEMGKAIKAQIESERDAMVDALYPVIGSTISKYMVELIQDINCKVESTFSPKGIKRKIKARIQGVSEAELIFKESIGYHVRAIFLINKNSGLVIQEIQVAGTEYLDSDLVAGMLTAIRSFANDCISANSELDSIDYGGWQIPLEVAGYCYLAVVVEGEPPQKFVTKIRRVLGEIVMEYDNVIKDFDGNIANVPPGIRTKLEQLIESKQGNPQKPASSLILLWLLIFSMSIVFVPWGIVNYRARVAHKIEQIAATQLDTTPELSIYRLDPQVKAGKLTVTGRVPSDYLRTQAGIITQKIASQHQLQLDNQIVTINVPVNPSLVTGEIRRLTKLFNQQPQVAIETNYAPKVLTVKGFILDKTIHKSINQAFQEIPGIEQIVFNVRGQLPLVEQRIFFNPGSSKLDIADNLSKIKATKKLLRTYPQLHLKLVVHSDGSGSTKINQRLGKQRCQVVKTALIEAAIEPTRLILNCNDPILPSNKANNRPWWSNRYVRFEPFIPPNLSQ